MRKWQGNQVILFLAVLSKIAGTTNQGAIQGYASSAGSLASIIGLLSGGIIYGIIGIKTFWIAAILMLVIFLLLFGTRSFSKDVSEIADAQ